MNTALFSGTVKKRISRGFTYLTLVVLSMVMIVPFVWLVRSSFMGTLQIFKSPIEWIPDPLKLDNFTKAMSSAPFDLYFLNTLILVANALVGTIISASLAAFAFCKLKWPGRNIVFILLLSTMMLPFTVTMIPLYVTWSRLGFIGTRIPLMVPVWLGGGVFNIFLLRQFFKTIPTELEEASYIDGATPFGVYLKIVMPLAKPALIVVGIRTFLATWNDFLGPILYLSEKQYTLSVGLNSFNNNYIGKWDLLMAATTIVTLPVIIVFFFAQRYFIEGIHLSGLKG